MKNGSTRIIRGIQMNSQISIMTFVFIFLGLLPSFAWLIFFLKEDVHPEPKRMIAKVFFAGVLITFFATAFQLLFSDVFKSFNIEESAPVSFLAFAFIEETFKFLAAYLVVRKSRFFDEPVDAMIYMIVASLGFAMAENMMMAFNILNFVEVFKIIIIRFVGATLLHALSSAVVGYYWAKHIIAKNASQRTASAVIVKGILLASLLHAIFNYLIIISEEQMSKMLIYPIIFLIIIALFIFWDFEKIKGSVQKS